MQVRYPRMPDTLSFLLQKGVKCKENLAGNDVMGTVLEHTRKQPQADLIRSPPRMNMVYRLINASLMMAPPGRDVPDCFDDAAAYGDVLIPAIHHNVLLTAVQEKLVAQLEWTGAVGA